MNSTSAADPALPMLSSPRLRRLCLLIRALAALGAVVLVGLFVWYTCSPSAMRLQWLSMSGCNDDRLTIDARAMWLGALVMLPSTLVGLYALWCLWRLFGEYGAGRVFSRVSQRYLRGFAVGVTISALLSPLERVLLGLVLSIGNPPGQRMLTINFSSEDYVSLLIGAVLLAVATVMAEAARLAEDHAGFV